MTAPFTFGRPRRRLEIDPTRVNQALAFGEETDDIDQRLGAEEPEPRPRGMWNQVKAALPDAVGNSLASNLDPQGGFVERFLGGIGRGYVNQQAGVRQREAEQQDAEGNAMRIKLALLGRQQEQRRLDIASRPDAPYDPNTDPAVQGEVALRDRGLGRYFQAPSQPFDPNSDPEVLRHRAEVDYDRAHPAPDRSGSSPADIARERRQFLARVMAPSHDQFGTVPGLDEDAANELADRAGFLVPGSQPYQRRTHTNPHQPASRSAPPSGGSFQARGNPASLPDPKATFDSLSQRFGGDLGKVRAEMERMGFRFED